MARQKPANIDQSKLQQEALKRQSERDSVTKSEQIASTASTSPIPQSTRRSITNRGTNSSSGSEIIVSNIESSLDSSSTSDLPPLNNTTHPPEFIDGITLSTESGEIDSFTTTTENVISIVQNATDSNIKRKIIESSTVKAPDILSSIKLPFLEFTSEEIDDAIEVGQFERQIVKETILQGFSLVAGKDPSGLYTEAKKELKNSQDLLEKQTSAVAEIMSAANSASTGLNILKMSPQIMQRSSEAVRALVVDTEKCKNDPSESLPASIDDYIKITYPAANSIDELLTNTSRAILIMQDMLVSSLSIHPSLLSRVSRSSSTKSIFSIAENFSYDLDGVPGDNDRIPTVEKVFSQNTKSIISAFIDKRVGEREVVGLLNEGKYASSSQQWDIISHLITCLSNEMILSAGIGRLQGSQLAERFFEKLSLDGARVLPFHRLFGESPTASAETVSRFFRTGIGRSSSLQGSFLDYMALGEETVGREFIVMPFEVDTVIADLRLPYAAGKKYFIDFAIQETSATPGVQPIRDSLKTFSNQFKSFTSDASSYMTDILSLGVNTKLSPQILFARILQDFREIVKSMSSGVRSSGGDSNTKSIIAAALFASLGSGRQLLSVDTSQRGVITDEELSPELIPESVRSRFGFIGSVKVSSRDVLKCSVVKAYSDLLAIAPDEKSTPSLGSLSVSISDEASVKLVQDLVTQSNISSAWRMMSDARAGGITLVDRGGAARTYGNPGEYLHDKEFDVKDNIVNLIAKFVREVQRESYNLASRDGVNATYQNSLGNTAMSNCDVDRLIDVICEIYIRLAPILLPFIFSPIRPDDIRTGLRGVQGYTCAIDESKTIKSQKLLEIIIQRLSRGEKVTASDISTQVEISETASVGFSVFSRPAGGFYFIPGGFFESVSDEASNVSEIVSRSNKFVNHRFYIKSSLKIIESIAECVSSSSARISRIFDILGGTLRRDRLSDSEKVIYDMFVTNGQKYENLLSSINDYQANLCTAARYTQVSTEPIHLRRDIDTTRSERLAVRDYVRSLRDQGSAYSRSGDNIYLMTVGIPQGSISSLTSTVFGREVPISSAFKLGSAGNESRSISPLVSIDLYRHDQSRVTISEENIRIFKGDIDDKVRLYDPEIFIMPDSISYNPSTLEPSGDPIQNSPGSILEKILTSTKFYRIKSGRIIETVQGSTSLPPQYRNALISYLLDLYLYDTVRVRYNDALGPRSSPTISQSGYRLMNEISSSPELSLLLMSRPGFSRLVDPTTLKMKNGPDLLDLITQRSRFTSPEFTIDNYKMATVAACVNIMSDMSYVLEPRPYDRIYHFLYDESQFQERAPDLERDRRKKADIFTLSTSLRFTE